jgi:hypothetical protein
VNDIRAAMNRARPSVIAFMVGVLLVWAVPITIALVAAAPGLRSLILAIKATGLPRPETFFVLANFLPALLSSFAIGFVMFRLLRGNRRVLWVAAAAPWVLHAIDLYVDLCLGTDVSCLGPYGVAGLIAVPLGLLLAAAVCGTPDPRHPGGGELQRKEAAAPQV